MVISDQLHALAALSLGRNPGTIEYEPGRVSEPVQRFCGREKNICVVLQFCFRLSEYFRTTWLLDFVHYVRLSDEQNSSVFQGSINRGSKG